VSDIDLIRIHQGGDCYVNAVRADSFGPCAVEAALCDKLIINTKHVGSATYFNSTNAIMVDSDPISVFTSDFTNINTFTIYEQWYEPNISSIRSAMRQAYNMSNQAQETIVSRFDKSIFDHKAIGEAII
jgi:hypothetical protein